MNQSKYNEIAKTETNIQKWNKSYLNNKEEYIRENGESAWRDKCTKKDSNSIDYYIKKYGTCYIKEKEKRTLKNKRLPKVIDIQTAKEWLLLEYKIHNKGEWVSYLKTKLMNKNHISKKFLLDRVLNGDDTNYKFKNIIKFGITSFNLNEDELYTIFEVSSEIKKIKYDINKHVFSYTVTKDGYFFRSDAEYTLYELLSVLDNVNVIDVNKRYPNSTYFYDFLIEYNSTEYYIELCGVSNKESIYVNKQLVKNELFNSILIGYNDIRKFVNDLKENIDVTKNEYYRFNIV